MQQKKNRLLSEIKTVTLRDINQKYVGSSLLVPIVNINYNLYGLKAGFASTGTTKLHKFLTKISVGRLAGSQSTSALAD